MSAIDRREGTTPNPRRSSSARAISSRMRAAYRRRSPSSGRDVMVFASRRSVELDQQLEGQESLLDKREDREALLRLIAVGVVEDENGSARHAVQCDLTAHTARPDVPAVGYRFGRADLTESAIGLVTTQSSVTRASSRPPSWLRGGRPDLHRQSDANDKLCVRLPDRKRKLEPGLSRGNGCHVG